jgi:hypothetical protein
MTEAYDAKIFAISSLLSSLLVYNTVGNIDQSYIDYIEILARRAQLFSMKMELKNADQTPRNDVELMKFPPLLWVIQDFVLSLAGQTATQWLNELLRTPSKDGKSSSSVPEIFDTIECKTLFYPVLDGPERLRNLDQVDREDLDVEYRRGMDELREHILKTVQVKKRGVAKMNGPLLVALLNTLVQGANMGQFPSVPSTWDTFIQLASSDAQSKSIRFLEKKYTKEFEGNTFSDKQLKEKLKEMDETLYSTFKSLMLGVEADEKREESLARALKSIKNRLEDLNNRKLDGEIKRKMEELNQVDQTKFTLPALTSELQDSIDFEIQSAEAKFDADLMSYQECEKFRHYKNMLLSTLRSEFEKLKALNREKFNQLFTASAKIGRESFVDYVKKRSVDAVPPDELELHFKEGKAFAFEKFHEACQISKASSQEQDSNYKHEVERHVAILGGIIRDVSLEFKEENERKIYTMASHNAVPVKRRFRDNLDSISLPLVNAMLREQIKISTDRAHQEFQEANSKFLYTAGYARAFKEVEASMQTEIDHVLQQNQDQMYLFTNALTRVRERLIEDAPNYYLDWSFKRHAVELVLADLEGVINDSNLRRETAEVIVFYGNADNGMPAEKDILPQAFHITFTQIFMGCAVIALTALLFVFRR